MNRSLDVSRPVRGRARLRTAACCAVLVALSLGVSPSSSADTAGDKKRVDDGIAQLRTALEDTSQVLANAFVELHRTTAELPGARQTLAAADAATVAADRHRDEVATALAVAAAKEAKAAAWLARNARAIEQVQNQLGNLVRDDYQQGGVSGLSIALGSRSPQDFTNRLIMMDTVMRVRDATLRGLHTMRAQGVAGEAHLAAVRRRMVQLRVQAEDALGKATAARARAVAAKAKLDLLYTAQARDAATVAARRTTEITNLKNMQAESDFLARTLAARAKAAREAAARARAARRAAARALAARQSAALALAAREAASRANRRALPPAVHPTPPAAPISARVGALGFPSDAPVSSEFGMRFHPIWRRWILHAGIDFAADCGSPVRAAADGDVILVTPEPGSGGYGNRLVIDHGLMRGVDLTTTYNHLTSFVVTSGHVARGQLVAYSGTTGSSTGCHLHFETRQDGRPVNPRGWL